MIKKFTPTGGADELRRTVALLDNCREDFNDRFTAEQLLKLARAYRRSGWDIPPDRWTERQISEAMRAIAPEWDENEQPIYPVRKKVPPFGLAPLHCGVPSAPADRLPPGSWTCAKCGAVFRRTTDQPGP